MDDGAVLLLLGTFGSDGEFNPFAERADGPMTLDWIRT